MKYQREFYMVTVIICFVTFLIMLATAFGFCGYFHMHWFLWVLDIGVLLEMMFASALCITFLVELRDDGKEKQDG